MATNQERTLAGSLAAAGYQFPFDVSGLISDAVTNGGSDPASYFYAKLIRSPAFRTHYAGIFNANGTLKMTPAAYDQYVHAATAAARSSGFNVTRTQVGRLVGMNVSGEEFTFRLEAANRIRANRQVFNSLNQVLKAKGLAPVRNAQQALDFMAKRENRAVYEAYEAATVQAAAAGAGIEMDATRAISTSKLTPGVTSFEDLEKSYAEIAEQGRLASVELGAEGVTLRDLEVIQFGGTHRAERAAKVQRILASRTAQAQEKPLAAQASLRDGRVVVGAGARKPGL